MWLINTSTLKRQDFSSGEVPDYAILSHTWGAREVSFQDLGEDVGIATRQLVSYAKIENCCKQAKTDGLEWLWVDTCCIDKTSSAELTEAINSMFAWYSRAQKCYAYLVDVVDNRDLEQSLWFTRGWTLQELIAPSHVAFYNKDWDYLGSKVSHPREGRAAATNDHKASAFRGRISRATNIPENVLSVEDGFTKVCVAQRMSWASRRRTTRPEDLAYCLMGLFDVNIPVIYGEGLSKAYRRLQLEIMSETTDQSIFAWDYTCPLSDKRSLLAESPAGFLHSSKVTVWGIKGYRPSQAFQMTNTGLRAGVVLLDAASPTPLALLECGVTDSDGRKHRVAIPLELCQRREGRSPGMYTRRTDMSLGTLTLVTWDAVGMRLGIWGAKESNTEEVIIMESRHYSHWQKLRLQSYSG